MNINNYSEFSDFLYGEIDKLSEFLGVPQTSKSFVKYCEKQLQRYARLYSKPLYKQAQRELRIKNALNTQPHGAVWHFFHSRLWNMCKIYEAQHKQSEFSSESASINVYPQVVQPMDVQQISDLTERGQG